MADLDFLDTIHSMWTKHAPIWRMNERRAFGNVVDDLLPFVGEGDDRYKLRQNRATYVNFQWAHASTITGHLRQQGAPPPESPDFSMGNLGVIRPIEQVDEASADPAETIYYNFDGVGGEGSEMPVFHDSVDERAQHTGHRILMVEAPPSRVLPSRGGAFLENPELTLGDFRRGRRVFTNEYSPLEMPWWLIINGVLMAAILRVQVDYGAVVDGTWKEAATGEPKDSDPFPGRGYYLLVRRGCQNLGPRYAGGGWWLYRPDKTLARYAPWRTALNGEVPLWLHYGEKSTGTLDMPALSRSATDGLGRVGVSLMDMLSARDWDAFDAAGSRKWFLNANATTMQEVYDQWVNKSQNIAVPPAFDEASGESHPVTIYDDSAGAVAPAVFQAIIDGKFIEAREQSFQAITSLPGSSGISKQTGFMEIKAPYLARRAAYRQQSEQNNIRALEMRSGFAARGFSKYKRDYTLEPLVDDIERAFEILRMNKMRSATMETEMAMRAVRNRLGGIPVPPSAEGQAPISEDTIRQELRDSIEANNAAAAQAAALAASFGGQV